MWFHPDPADPEREAGVVTDSARTSTPDWILVEIDPGARGVFDRHAD